MQDESETDESRFGCTPREVDLLSWTFNECKVFWRLNENNYAAGDYCCLEAKSSGPKKDTIDPPAASHVAIMAPDGIVTEFP